MDHHAQVTEAARSLGLLDADGKLVRLDSLMMVDLVIAIEDFTGLAIPADVLREETFQSIESVTAMVITLAAEKASA